MSEKRKVPHRRANGFTSVYATGVVSSYVPFGGSMTLTFYEDVIGINSETLEMLEDGTKAKTSFEDGDLEPHREDKVRVTLMPDAAAKLYQLLKEQFGEFLDGVNTDAAK